MKLTQDHVKWLYFILAVLKLLGHQVGPFSPRHGASSVCGWNRKIFICEGYLLMLNKKLMTADKVWSPGFGVECTSNKRTQQNCSCYES